ncbi:hypothetical protein BZG35_15405 [Brevundimonas sp. LM2]|uniref:hypothetical protein n=1 Tax=Brevundimonas sp. LM2 TaxID=1938605 RepID=UPI0009839695|nr:hypothetical protein [Brevundimonas sp. LM2]AQR62886.1 hypothetical protein BZG35_15405 [Brevundimonas sp. LM2]
MTPTDAASEDDAAPVASRPDVFSGSVPPAAASFPPSAAARAYRTVAWRAPTPTRFDGRPANDFLARAEAVAPLRVWRAPPPRDEATPAGWLTFGVGAVIAAVLGALVGGLMAT